MSVPVCRNMEIFYRPDLRRAFNEKKLIEGCPALSVAGAILLSRLEFYFSISRDGFRRSMGEWIAELGFSQDEFSAAFSELGVIRYEPAEDLFQGKLYLAWVDKVRQQTYYYRNHPLVDGLMAEAVQAGGMPGPAPSLTGMAGGGAALTTSRPSPAYINPNHPAARVEDRFKRYQGLSAPEVKHQTELLKFWPSLAEAGLGHLWVGPGRMDLDPALKAAAKARLQEQDKPSSHSDVILYLQNRIRGLEWAALEALKAKGDELAAAEAKRDNKNLRSLTNCQGVTLERLELLVGGVGQVDHVNQVVIDPETETSIRFKIVGGRPAFA